MRNVNSVQFLEDGGFYFCKHGDEPSTSVKALSISCDIGVGLMALNV